MRAGAIHRSVCSASIRCQCGHETDRRNLGILALKENAGVARPSFFAKADAKTYYLIAQAQFHAHDFQNASLAIARAIKLNPAEPQFHALSEEIQRAQTSSPR
jgi:hypothetical protein